MIVEDSDEDYEALIGAAAKWIPRTPPSVRDGRRSTRVPVSSRDGMLPHRQRSSPAAIVLLVTEPHVDNGVVVLQQIKSG
jgi:hypothetical protein